MKTKIKITFILMLVVTIVITWFESVSFTASLGLVVMILLSYFYVEEVVDNHSDFTEYLDNEHDEFENKYRR